MKKFMSILLALVLCVAMAVPAFAASSNSYAPYTIETRTYNFDTYETEYGSLTFDAVKVSSVELQLLLEGYEGFPTRTCTVLTLKPNSTIPAGLEYANFERSNYGDVSFYSAYYEVGRSVDGCTAAELFQAAGSPEYLQVTNSNRRSDDPLILLALGTSSETPVEPETPALPEAPAVSEPTVEPEAPAEAPAPTEPSAEPEAPAVSEPAVEPEAPAEAPAPTEPSAEPEAPAVSEPAVEPEAPADIPAPTEPEAPAASEPAVEPEVPAETPAPTEPGVPEEPTAPVEDNSSFPIGIIVAIVAVVVIAVAAIVVFKKKKK